MFDDIDQIKRHLIRPWSIDEVNRAKREHMERDNKMMSERDFLKYVIKKHAMRFGDFTLASGKKSNYYINMKKIMLDAPCLRSCASVLFHQIRNFFGDDIRMVAGVPTGGTILASAISVLSVTSGYGYALDQLLVRKAAKDHGTAELIEQSASAVLTDYSILVVEDVTTTGNSTLNTLKTIEAHGARPAGAITLVDRGDEAEGKIVAHGFGFCRIFTIGEIKAE